MAKKDRTGVVEKEPKADEIKLGDAHPDHDLHLCHIVGLRNMKTAARLSKGAQHICIICGRAAKDRRNLCEPAKI